jgi:hypothetical protein
MGLAAYWEGLSAITYTGNITGVHRSLGFTPLWMMGGVRVWTVWEG